MTLQVSAASQPVAAMMEGSVHVFDNLEAVKDLWEELYQALPTVGPFMAWPYISLWWRYFGRPYTPYVLVAIQHGKPVAILPLMRRAQELRWLATPGPDNVALLYSPRHLNSGLAAIAQHLRHESWIKLSAGYLSAEDATQLTDAFGGFSHRTVQNTGSPYIEIQGRTWEDYFESLPSAIRRDLRNMNNRLGRDNLEIRFESASDPARITELFPTIKTIMGASSSLDAKRETLTGTHGDFILDVCREYSARGWLIANIAWLNDKPASYAICFTMNQITGYWMTAYDEQFQNYSPSKLLLAHMIQSSFERGDRVFDFMHGMESYKLRWTDKIQPLTYVIFYRNPMIAQIANLQARVKALLKH